MDTARSRIRQITSPSDLARLMPLGDLLAIGTQLHGDVDPALLMQEVADVVHRVLGFPQVYIRLRNPDTDDLLATAFAGLSTRKRSWLLSHPTAPSRYQALLRSEFEFSESYLIPAGVRVEDEVAARPIYGRRGPRILRGPLLLVPLRGRGGRLLGVIYTRVPGGDQSLSLPSVQILEAIARQAALGLEHARLYARTARLLAKEQLLVELGRDVSSTLNLDTILQRTVAHLKAAYQRGTVLLMNNRQELEIVAHAGHVDPDVWIRRLEVGEGVCTWVVQHGTHFLSNNLDHEARVPAPPPDSIDNQVGSCLGVPLLTGGQVLGALMVLDERYNAFSYEDVDLLEAVATQISGPIATSRLYQQAQQLAAEVQRRAEQLTVLNALARAAASTPDLSRALAQATDILRRGFGYDQVDLYLLDEENRELLLTAAARASGPLDPVPEQSVPSESGVMGRALRTGSTQRVDDILIDPDYCDYDLSTEIRSELCVPVIASGRVLGVLNLEAATVAAFSDEDVSVLETSADVLAGAIESARLYQRAQEAAVLEERNRLARDLHDSVSQQLFSMTLTAQAARAQLEKNPLRAGVQLERLQETAQAALAEMRALIYQLRPPSLRDQGLVHALQQHAAAVGRREGLNVSFDVQGDDPPGYAEEQALFRIAQEALNNVVKHAQARQVNVLLELNHDGIRLCIRDDGRGFEPDAPPQTSGQHLGLTGMRERATELGGYFELQSAPGAGTQVTVIVPRRQRLAAHTV